MLHHIENGWNDGSHVYTLSDLPSVFPVTLTYGQALKFSIKFDVSYSQISSLGAAALYYSEVVVESNDPASPDKKVNIVADATISYGNSVPLYGLILRANQEEIRGIYNLDVGSDGTVFELVLPGIPKSDGTLILAPLSSRFNGQNVMVSGSGVPAEQGQISLDAYVRSHSGSILGITNDGVNTFIQFKMSPPPTVGFVKFSFFASPQNILQVFDYTTMCSSNILSLLNQVQQCVGGQSRDLQDFFAQNPIIDSSGRVNFTNLGLLQSKADALTACIEGIVPELHAVLDLARRLQNFSPDQIPEITTGAADLIRFLPLPAKVKQVASLAAQVAPLIRTLLSHASKADKVIALAGIAGAVDNRLGRGIAITRVIFRRVCFYSVQSSIYFDPGFRFLPVESVSIRSYCPFVIDDVPLNLLDSLSDALGDIRSQIGQTVAGIQQAVNPGGVLDCDPDTKQCTAFQGPMASLSP
ncbi:MAG TPA: hypothetical protein VF905_06970, partial [Nitrospirota bacterium]